MPLQLTNCEWLLSGRNDSEPPAAHTADTEALPPCPVGQVRMEQVSVLGDAALFFFKARFDDASVLCLGDGRSGSDLGLILTRTGNYRLRTEGCGQPWIGTR